MDAKSQYQLNLGAHTKYDMREFEQGGRYRLGFDDAKKEGLARRRPKSQGAILQWWETIHKFQWRKWPNIHEFYG